METASLPAGTPLVEEGEEGDAFFVILEGEVEIVRMDRESEEVLVVHTRGGSSES